MLAVSTPWLHVAGLSVGWPWLLPFLVAVPAWWVLVTRLRRRQPRVALADMWLWAFALAVTSTVAPIYFPEQSAAVVWNGVAYRDEMHHWLASGIGAEGTPRAFLPLHARDLAIFAVAALISGSLLAMAFGAALMAYMGFYVASLVAAGGPIVVALVGWHPWSLVRVAGFVLLGVLLAEPTVAPGVFAGRRRLWYGVAAGLLALDVALKTALAETWRGLLNGYLP